MKFMHLNTQSMLSSLDELILTVEKYPFDIVTMSETWLKDNQQLLNYVKIPGYSQEFRNRNNLRGGGVGAYIMESLKYKQRKDIKNLEHDLEHLWLEIPGRNKHSKLLLGTMYRSEKILPFKDWLEKFEAILSHLTTTWDGLVVVSGDMNIDLNDNNSTAKKNYMEMLSALNLHQHVNKSTRITNKTSTLIDHIISNASDRISYTDVLPCPLVSDHDAVYACVNIKVPRFEKRYKFIRHEKNFREEDFIADFKTLPLSSVYGVSDPEDKIHIMNSLIKECIDRNAPLKRTKITRPPAPWLKDPDIVKAKAERNLLQKNAPKNKNDDEWQKFRDVRN